MEDLDLEPGVVLLGKYRVDEHLGTGGMGRVIRASHLYLQQSVAIKILLPELTQSASTVARFLREAQAAVRLKSEHTARVIDVGTLPDGTPFMIMEYLEGNDLNQILRHHGPQQPNIVVDLVLQACEGLAEAHAIGIVHRDVKPSNFFITRRPDGTMLLKILDFGISKTPIGGESDLTGPQTVGTPTYMAPEQMKSGKQADARSDIWSLGVVMYQLLQGRPPFSAESFADLVTKVHDDDPTPLMVPLPAGLREVILRCLEKAPHDRHQNVGELARMLAPFSSDPITASQIATRTARILQTRASQPSMHRDALPGQQSLPVGAHGGLAAPLPVRPAQFAPRGWPPSTSSSHGRGQMTARVHTGRGWLVAGALSLAILCAAGGYVASNLMKDPAPAREAPAPASAPTSAPAATTAAPTIAPAPPPPTVPAPIATPPALPVPPPSAAPPVETAAPAATAVPKSSRSRKATSTAKSSTSTAKSSSKVLPSSKAPAASKPVKPTKKSGGLFDSRH